MVSYRAVQAALPWLQKAGAVQVVHVGDHAGELAVAEQFLSGLGVRAALHAVPGNGLADGERLLAEAEALDADWLVMGAYRRRQIVEWMLGGVTRTVLGTSTVPGIDFTNDPLLQGRNQSYLDTQIKRLGGPNFAEIPINQPQCPMRNFQRDGHMQMRAPKGRVSYSPSSLSETTERADAAHGFVSVPAHEEGSKLRARSATFADHYSQAGQFFFSQTMPEQNHIVSAFIFELSKVETEAVRLRLLSHLANVDEGGGEARG